MERLLFLIFEENSAIKKPNTRATVRESNGKSRTLVRKRIKLTAEIPADIKYTTADGISTNKLKPRVVI